MRLITRTQGLTVKLEAAHTFLRAANYIRKYGWQEKGMGIYGQPRCSMGALASVYPDSSEEKLPQLMYDKLYEELDGLSLTQYNHKFQSGEMVARLYERVARKLQTNEG